MYDTKIPPHISSTDTVIHADRYETAKKQKETKETVSKMVMGSSLVVQPISKEFANYIASACKEEVPEQAPLDNYSIQKMATPSSQKENKEMNMKELTPIDIDRFIIEDLKFFTRFDFILIYKQLFEFIKINPSLAQKLILSLKKNNDKHQDSHLYLPRMRFINAISRIKFFTKYSKQTRNSNNIRAQAVNCGSNKGVKKKELHRKYIEGKSIYTLSVKNKIFKPEFSLVVFSKDKEEELLDLGSVSPLDI